METFLTLNGVGHGHLMRTLLACRWLRRRSRRPVVFFQGHYPSWEMRRQPGVTIPALHYLPRVAAQSFADEIARYVELTEPAVIIEDTYPAPVTFPPTIRRLLLIQPTVFGHVRKLIADYGDAIERFIVCDSPDSPSWPYTDAETDELRSLEKWTCIGPIFRQPTSHALDRVRRRYALNDGRPTIVFSMGGGGIQRGCRDREQFLTQCEPIVDRLRSIAPDVRLQFVCGPLWPGELTVPACFEVVRYEPDLHALFACAAGAVIRPGFNANWECIAGRTPFVPLLGTYVYEPTDLRIQRMARCGLVADSVARFFDDKWLKDYRRACENTVAVHSGEPVAGFLNALDSIPRRSTAVRDLEEHSATEAQSEPAFESLKGAIHALRLEGHLLLRMDDVVTLDETVSWLLTVCRRHGLFASLEVIPYLFDGRGTQLASLDRTDVFEVSQHGFAHLPQRDASGTLRGDLLPADDDTFEMIQANVRKGYRLLRRSFGDRFKGGYSAPFDDLPPWLPRYWSDIGGRHVSWIATAPASVDCGNAEMAVDTADRNRSFLQSPEIVLSTSLQSLRSRGYVGLVLHPRLLRRLSHRRHIECVIASLAAAGLRGRRLSEAAAPPPRRAQHAAVTNGGEDGRT